jgi:hypothetical protein
MGSTISSMGYRDLRLARLIGCVIAGPGPQVFDRQLSSDPRNGFRSRRRANGPSKSMALFPRCTLRRPIKGRRLRCHPTTARITLCHVAKLRNCASTQHAAVRVRCRCIQSGWLFWARLSRMEKRFRKEPQACALESWIPFPTPGQWTEQIDGTLPARQITQNDQWSTIKSRSNYGVVYMRE